MEVKKIIISTTIIFVFAVFVNINTDINLIKSFIDKLTFRVISSFVGLSIAIVGIFLGSVSNIYLSLYKFKKTDNESLTDKEMATIKGGLDELIQELKENSIFTLFTYITILIIYVIREMDLPFIVWMLQHKYFTENIILNSLILMGSSLIFWAIWDSVKVVFQIVKFFAYTNTDKKE